MGVGWYLHRFRAMSVAELAHRAGERWKHLGDASFAGNIRNFPPNAVAQPYPALPDRGQAPEELRRALMRDSEALQSGNWELFGWRKVEVGSPPCWHRDATCGVVVPPQKLAHHINHRSLGDLADARTIWEVNRWSEMTRLAMHGWLNEDANAMRTALIWLEDWWEQNPLGYGINWTSPLEAGLRLINFTWLHALLKSSLKPEKKGSDSLEAGLQQLTQNIVPAHAAWVWRYKSFGSSANNHLLGELVGLLHAVKRWPELESQICPASELWDEISRCIMEQFAEDGGNNEQALHYHLFAWEMAWHAVRLMEIKEGRVMDRLLKAAEFFSRMTHGEEPWDYGDNDDAQIVPLTMQRSHAVREWQAWMKGEQQGRAASLNYWLGEIRVPKSGSRSEEWWMAPQSGMAVIERDGWKVRLDASPLGFGKMAAHGHCDALHLSIWDGKEALIIDPGTGGYYGMKERRAELASWDAHNGPQPVAGYKTPRRMGTFLWAEHHERLDLHQVSACRLQSHISHEGHGLTRRVEVRDDDFVSVEDISAKGESFRVCWQLAPECRIKEEAPNTYSIARGKNVWRVKFDGGEIKCKRSERKASARYGEFTPCIVLEVHAEALLKTLFTRVRE